jgi:hypothetical protein
MERQRVASTNIESIGYDGESSTLEVEFHHGGIYQYSGVPSDVYLGLMAADSHGKFLDVYVKKANYPYRRVG